LIEIPQEFALLNEGISTKGVKEEFHRGAANHKQNNFAEVDY
jgi:hypothetical protein